MWKRVYFNVGRKADFSYTFDQQEAREKQFSYHIGQIAQTTLKIPSRNKKKLLADEVTNDFTTAKSSDRQKRASSEGRKEAKENEKPVKAMRVGRRGSEIFEFKVFD